MVPTPVSSTFNLRNWIIREEVGNERNVLLNAVMDGKDNAGNQLYSIGYGHQIQPTESDLLTRTITITEANALLQADLNKFSRQVKAGITVPINQNQEIALISLAYNIGINGFLGSTLLRKLNARDYMGASEEFKNWRLSEGRVVAGLVARRERERVLFMTPV